MHSLHLRLPKNFVLEERLDRYANAIEARPSSYAGRWLEACTPLVGEARKEDAGGRLRELRVDLGCGKGSFLVEAARREPDVLFLGIDSEPICVAYAAQAVCEAQLTNALVIPGTAEQMCDYFAPGEVARIYLNFPTPHPKRRHATQRMVHADQLIRLRTVLAPTGELVFKTDSGPLFAYAKTQFAMAGYELAWTSEDVRAERPNDPSSGYEDKLSAQGACVYGICATPTLAPLGPSELERAQGEISQSLVDYLPDDLAAMTYVPHGMQATVENLANLEAKGRPRSRGINTSASARRRGGATNDINCTGGNSDANASNEQGA
jgi:tRNA (guanine-N7-)-methyltransferase